MANPDQTTGELAALVAAALTQGCNGIELEAVKDALQRGEVGVRRDDDGRITVRIGDALDVELHAFDLPSVASEWEAAAT